MSSLYFECANGISGDMSVAALLDLGADRFKLDKALNSINLNNEFSYEIKEVTVNTIKATDFNVIIKHNHHEHVHEHRNLDDINSIINKADSSENSKKLAKRIFEIVAQAEAIVHRKNIKDVHFHEVGAIDSIVDILGFSVLFDDLNPKEVYFRTISEGQGSVECAHGIMSVPVPAVCEIASRYKLPLKLTDNEGEMITPTGAAIAAVLYTSKKLPDPLFIENLGCGAGKRPYPNPVLRVMKING